MRVNPLHLNISLRILHTVLYTFPEVEGGKEDFFNRTASFVGDLFFFYHNLNG